jgi:hypothetical protein
MESALVVFAVGGSFVIFQYAELLWHTFGLTMAMNFLTAEQVARAAAAKLAAKRKHGPEELQPTWSNIGPQPVAP